MIDWSQSLYLCVYLWHLDSHAICVTWTLLAVCLRKSNHSVYVSICGDWTLLAVCLPRSKQASERTPVSTSFPTPCTCHDASRTQDAGCPMPCFHSIHSIPLCPYAAANACSRSPGSNTQETILKIMRKLNSRSYINNL
ncbi:uncharacterized protein LY89DRAFT_413387 [Mollisia scopiformis]|uniref:Uncharacterized protein n=1 Tax=Mollisia scopiformis TaxID=149040 RepID=A0A132B1U6_MOLSC|nr:uncharacterized protein LY89DRAFT_413387 [Mollisia scopiformis]KUJ06350.1 hypothetical protein LY89DRAFT_413387 [Mollisia scopiformis]